VARASEPAGWPTGAGRPVRNPLSLLRVDSAIARLAAVIGVAFFLQSIPLQLEWLPNMVPIWSWTMVSAIVASLLVVVVASIIRRGVKVTYIAFAVIYLIALLSWPFAVVDVDYAQAMTSSYWLYFLLTIATTMAAVSLDLRIATVYTVGAPIIYGIIRITPPGGSIDLVQALLDSVYSVLLGGAILILIAVLRYAAAGVDIAQQNALERYSHAVRQYATEAERVQVDAIVHDSVLTTLLSAARAYTPQAKRLAATMAGNAIGYLRDAAATAPDSDAMVLDSVLTRRIADAAVPMSQPFDIRSEGVGLASIPITAAEALYSATVQAMVNSLQHAGSDVERWVEVRVLDASEIEIEVGDRGAGFDLASIPTERLGVRVSILERMASAGGIASIDSAPGRGTVITLHWPHSGAPGAPQYEGFVRAAAEGGVE
jgi:signal transduction histidine kinase